MQTYKLTSRVPKRTATLFKRRAQPVASITRNMSLFPRSFISNIHDSPSSTSFHPLFRLLDDFDNYRTNTTTSSPYQTHSATMKTFTPKFDVKEVGEVYELHGELPGIAQKDIEIEFSDDSTITIKGRTERSYIEGSTATKAIDDSSSTPHKEHQPSVEDENAPANNEQQLERANPTGEGAEQRKEPGTKYWVSERSVGEFSRSFTFPVRVDQESVKASMRDGVLSVVVPKAKRVEGRKIVIQ